MEKSKFCSRSDWQNTNNEVHGLMKSNTSTVIFPLLNEYNTKWWYITTS